MSVSKEYLDYVQDLLAVIGPVQGKRMFGGAGLYHQGVFFGLVADDVLYFKVDDSNRADYEAAGSGPFRPFGTYAMSYYEVPADVLEEPDELAVWALKAIEVVGKEVRKKAVMKKGKKAVKKLSRIS
jgi:DNA transformation protein and related proteins